MAQHAEIVEHNGEICARFPPGTGQQVARLNIGKWDNKWRCWRFKRTPTVAHTLLSTFPVSHVDDQIKDLADTFNKAQCIKTADNLPDIPNLKTTAWLHQKQAYWFAKDLSGSMLAMGMGAGKTLAAIGLMINRPHATNIILCPKSVITVWPNEFQKHSKEQFAVIPLVDGTTKQKQGYAKRKTDLALASSKPAVIVVNYETFWRADLFSWLTSRRWDHLILDESHKIKSHNGKASKMAFKLSKQADYMIALTGTPMPHSALDIFAQYKVISPDIFGTNYSRFKTKHAVTYGPNNNWIDYNQIKNERELYEKFNNIAYQIGKDVLDLPEQIHTFRTCRLDNKQRKLYDKLDNQLYAEIFAGVDEDGKPMTPANAMVKVLRLQQLTSGYAVTDDGETIQVGSGKQELLKELLEEIPANEPIIAFARFKPDVANIRRIANELDRTSGELSGRVNNLKAWQDGKINVLAVNIQSGGVGIDLTRARYGIYYSIGHSNGDYQQSLSRIHRPGQKKSVTYYHLLTENTVDVTVFAALQSKQEVIERILSGHKGKLNEGKIL